MMKRKWLKRASAFALAMATMLSSVAVNATTPKEVNPGIIDTKKAVTLTIHKYEMETLDGAVTPGNGTTNVTLPSGAVALPGVTFDVYKVAADELETTIPKGVTPVTQTTGAEGTAVFTGLAQGRYLVVESKVPDKVYQKCANFLVDLPMVNPEGNGWNYDVHAYPKNAAVVGAVALTKTDKDTGKVLAGAKFKLQQKVDKIYVDMKDDAGKVRVFTTNDEGQLFVDGLFKGEYQFVETSAPTGYGINTTPISFAINKNATIKDDVLSANVVKVSATDVKTPVIEKSANKDSANVSDTVTWTLAPSVPSDIADYKSYVVTDVLDSRLDYVANSLKAVVTDVNGNSQDITDKVTVDTANGIKVTFTDRKILAGMELAITFDTKVNSNAAEKPGNIENQASISYENKYGTKDEKDSEKVKVYVGNICILKYEAGDKTKVLPGAQFALYKTEENALDGEKQMGTTVTTNAQGKAYFCGLETGDYWIVETQSPTYTENDVTKHYQLMTKPQKVTISKEDGGVVTVEIANKRQGFSIPKTGGNGTMIFLFGGLMIASGASALLAFRRRKVQG